MPAHTLVIHPGALGDVLLAVPALRALAAADPGERLVMAAQPRIGELLRVLGVVDRSVDFESLGLDALFSDVADIDRARAIAGAARVVCWFGAKDAGFVRRLSSLARDVVVAPPHLPDRPVWEHLLASVGALSRRPPSSSAMRRREPVRVPETLAAQGCEALRNAGWDGRTPVLMVHPGAGGARKRWPTDGFALALGMLLARRRLAVVVHEGPADRDAVKGLVACAPAPLFRLDNPSLPLLAGALTQAAAYLGNDSGVTHLAAAVGVPSVALFTSDAQAWRPWASGVETPLVSTATVDGGDVETVVASLTRSLERRAS